MAKPKLTFPEIIKLGGSFRADNAAYVKVLNLKKGYDKEGYAYAACQSVSTHIRDNNGRLHRVMVRRKHTTVVKFLDSSLKCEVSCSCEDFKFTWEYSLKRKGAAQIKYSNGDAPNTRNPANAVGCCKHLVALYWKIKPDLDKAQKVIKKRKLK